MVISMFLLCIWYVIPCSQCAYCIQCMECKARLCMSIDILNQGCPMLLHIPGDIKSAYRHVNSSHEYCRITRLGIKQTSVCIEYRWIQLSTFQRYHYIYMPVRTISLRNNINTIMNPFRVFKTIFYISYHIILCHIALYIHEIKRHKALHMFAT